MPRAVTGSDGGGTQPVSTELCHLDGNQVGILGDSYIQLSGDFTRDLQDTARKAGALGANDTYLDHSLSGASMDGLICTGIDLYEGVPDFAS